MSCEAVPNADSKIDAIADADDDDSTAAADADPDSVTDSVAVA